MNVPTHRFAEYNTGITTSAPWSQSTIDSTAQSIRGFRPTTPGQFGGSPGLQSHFGELMQSLAGREATNFLRTATPAVRQFEQNATVADAGAGRAMQGYLGGLQNQQQGNMMNWLRMLLGGGMNA